MLNSDIKITTLLYLILAAIIFGASVAYLTNRFVPNQKSEVLRSALQENVQSNIPSSSNFDKTNPNNQINSAPISPESPQPEDDQFCAQVITPARDPDTGRIVDFPTPCDVPEGWEIIDTSY